MAIQGEGQKICTWKDFFECYILDVNMYIPAKK